MQQDAAAFIRVLRHPGGPLEKAALAITLAAAAYYVGAFLFVAISRMGYPFALEWLEGGSYLQVHRILTGQPLYARPSMDYVPMIYPPLYYYVSAVVSKLLGFGLPSLRLVSFVSALGSMMIIYAICRAEGTPRSTAFTASGLFAATYPLSGSWFDIARVDMLSVFLVLAAIWMLRMQLAPLALAGGFLFALACLTKQTHLITLAFVSVYLLAFERRKALAFIGTCLVTLGTAYVLLDSLYSGWFGFFVLKLALGSPEYITFAPSGFLPTALDFWWRSIILALPVVVLVILTCLFVAQRRLRDLHRLHFYLIFAAGTIAASWSVIQVGGYKNDLLPAYASLAVLFGISLHEITLRAHTFRALPVTLAAACCLQFVLLVYPIRRQIPTAADLAAGTAFLTQIRAQAGQVYIPFHPDLALMAHKPAFASWSPMFQLEGNYGGGDIRAAGRVKTEFSRAMARQQFSLIVLDQDPNWIWGNPEMYYSARTQPVFDDASVFWPVTGWETRPRIWMIPNGK